MNESELRQMQREQRSAAQFDALCEGLKGERFIVMRLAEAHGRCAFVQTPTGLRNTAQMLGNASARVEPGAYLVFDNGGEIGVERINSGEIPRFVPSERWVGGLLAPVGPLTLLSWVCQALAARGLPSDPPFDFSENLDAEIAD